MGYAYKNIEDVFKEAKAKIADNKLTIKELSENAPINEELLNILLDDSNGVVKGLSDLVAFMKIRITSTKHNKFITHRFVESDEQIKVIRTLHPKCSMVYDIVGKKFYDFKTKYKADVISPHDKQLIINDMAKEVEIYLGV